MRWPLHWAVAGLARVVIKVEDPTTGKPIGEQIVTVPGDWQGKLDVARDAVIGERRVLGAAHLSNNSVDGFALAEENAEVSELRSDLVRSISIVSRPLLLLTLWVGIIFAAQPLHAQAPSGLIAYYKAENGGIQNEVPGGMYDAAWGSAFAGISGQPLNTTGFSGDAWSFDGSGANTSPGNFITIPNFGSLGSDSFTLSVWVNPDSCPFECQVVSTSRHEVPSGWELRLEGTGGATRFTFNPAGAPQSGISTEVPLGNWTHVTISYDDASGTASLFKNGAAVGSIATPGGFTQLANAALVVGENNNWIAPSQLWGPFLGQIDELRVYNRVLTPDEVRAVFVTVLNTDDSGPGSLRAAIDFTNTNNNSASVDEITFAVQGQIQITSGPLPPIVEPVKISGGAVCNEIGSRTYAVEVRGDLYSGAPLSGTGFNFAAGSDGSILQGLVIGGFQAHGVEVSSSNVTIRCNYIGTDVTGNAAVDFGSRAVVSFGSSNLIVGGPSPGDGNLVAGSRFYHAIDLHHLTNQALVQNNHVGIRADGTDLLRPTGGDGLSSIVGINLYRADDSSVFDNVIVGFPFFGMDVQNSFGHEIRGNFIGTDSSPADDPVDFGNGTGILFQKGSSDNLVADNSIAHNTGHGVSLTWTDTDICVLPNDWRRAECPTPDIHRNRITENRIFGNGATGIELGRSYAQFLASSTASDGATANDAGDADTGSNDLQNFPLIEFAVIDAAGDLRIAYSVNSVSPHASFPIRAEFFVADADLEEGKSYVGSDSYLAPGRIEISLGNAVSLGVSSGFHLLTTATAADGNTSEFSTQPVLVTAAPTAGFGTFVDSGQALGTSTRATRLGDLDGDGDLDAFIITVGADHTVWLNQGGTQAGTPGAFLLAQTIANLQEASEVALADLDGDGDLDAYLANAEAGGGVDRGNLVYLNNGSGSFSSTGTVYGPGDRTEGLAAADFDGDGDIDVFAVNKAQGAGSPQAFLWLNDGSAGFTPRAGSYSNGLGGAAGDIDQDGDPDLVIAEAGNVRIYQNDGTGSFTQTDSFNGIAASLGLADLNGDGSLDLVVGKVDDQANTVYLNNGTGTFSPSGQTLCVITSGTNCSDAYWTELGDVDADGDVDVVFGTTTGGSEVWLNDGSAGFTLGQVFGGTSNGLALGDIDGDGALDVVAAGSTTKAWINAAASTNAADTAVLVELYNAAAGASWTNKTGWLAGDPAGWYGVTVVASRVTKIRLSGNNLVGTLPASLGSLTALQVLDLGTNSLSGGIPGALSGATSLRKLNLYENALTGSIPSSLGSIATLTALQLYSNNLSGSIPSDLGSLGALNLLNLDDNQLTGTVPASFSGLGSLTYLSLTNNLLSGELPDLSATGLAELYLAGNGFTGRLPDLPVSIEHVAAIGNQFAALPDFSGGAFSALQNLNVEGNLLEFSDLLPNLGVPTSSYTFDPQGGFGDARALSAVLGGDRVLAAPIAGADTYQWLKNGATLAGQTASTLLISGATAGDAGTYALEATNSLLALSLRSGDLSLAIAADIEVPKGYVFEAFASGFQRPEGLAVDASGNVLIADAFTGEVRRFNVDGIPVSPDPLIFGLVRPVDLAVGDLGQIYVADEGSGGVHRILPGGAPIDASALTPWLSGLNGPSELAFGPNGSLYVAVSGGTNGEKILRVDPDTGTIETYMTFPDAADWDPQGMAWDAVGTLFVVARGTNSVLRVPAGQSLPINASTQTAAFSVQNGNGAAFGVDLKLYVATSTEIVGGLADAALLTPIITNLGGDTYAQVVFDQSGRMYLTDGASGRVVRVIAPENQLQPGFPMAYSVNLEGLPGVTDGSDFAAMQEAFDAWTAAPLSTVSFSGAVPTTPTAIAGNDGINLVTFVDDQFLMQPGVLAITAKTLILSGPDEAEIIDADIVFNPAYVGNASLNFGITSGPKTVPIGPVLVHELGHAFGLIHSGIQEASMFFALQPGDEALTLEYDDFARAGALYPSAAMASRGSIAGSILDGEALTLGPTVAGALVIATNTITGNAVSTYSDVLGDYLIPGLDPGDYEVDIQPLDGDVYGMDLRPRNISAYHRAITTNTSFFAELYSGAGENNSDSPTLSVSVSVSAGATTAGIDFVTNVDTTAPVVDEVFPLNGIPASTTEPVILTFSEPVDPGTLELSVYEDGAPYPGTLISGSVVLDGGRQFAIFSPTVPFRPATTYNIDLAGDLADLRGNTLGANFQSAFTTEVADGTTPTVVQITPEEGAFGVFINHVVTAVFSEPMDPASLTTASFAVTAAGAPVDGEVTVASGLDNTTALFTPNGSFPENTSILVTLTTTVKDAAGNPLGAGVSTTFTTIAAQTPSIVAVGPSNMTTGVSVSTPVLVDFDEPIAPSSVDALAVQVSPTAGGAAASGSFEFLLGDSRLVFRPDVPLAFGTTYTVLAGTGVEDVTGNAVTSTTSIQFTTDSAPPAAPVIVSVSPPSTAAGADVVIAGTGFDPVPGNNVVTFNGVQAEVTHTSLNSLSVVVPMGAEPGDLLVTVSGLSSNAFPFFVVTDPPSLEEAVKNVGTAEGGAEDVEVGPDGVKVLVTYPGTDVVQEIDLETTTVTGTITVGDQPLKVAINPTGTRAYVTNFGDHTVSVLDLTVSPAVVLTTVPVGLNPTGIAVAPDGSKVYVAELTSQGVSVIDTDPGSGAFHEVAVRYTTSEGGPEDVEAGPDGTKLYVAGRGGIFVIDVDATSPEYESVKLVSEGGAEDVEVGPDGTILFAVTTAGFIQIIDIDENSANPYAVISTSEGGVEKVEVGPDGTQLFATTSSGLKVFGISYTTGTADAVISLQPGLTLLNTIIVGPDPSGVHFVPGTATVVVANSGSDGSTDGISVVEFLDALIVIDLPETEPGPFTIVADGDDTVVLASNGEEVFRMETATLVEIRINGTSLDDHLIVDYSNGAVAPGAAPIAFYGGDQESEGDRLTVTGASANTVVHEFFDEHSGRISVDGFGDITYFELEPVSDNMGAVNRLFTLTSGMEQTVTLSPDGDGASGNGISFIDSDNGSESISFANPTGTISIVGDAGSDTFLIGNLDTPSVALTSLSVTGSVDPDSFRVAPSAYYPISITGGSASVCADDVLALNLGGVSGASLSVTGPGTGVWTFDAPHQPVSFSGIGSLPDADANVSMTASQTLFYTTENGELVLTVTNDGTNDALCVKLTLPQALYDDVTTLGLLPSGGVLAAGPPPTWTIPVLAAGATETLTLTGLISGIMPITYPIGLISGGAAGTGESITISPGFRFPAQAHVTSALEAEIEILVGGSTYTYRHLVAGLFQGAPGYKGAVWCSLPEEIPTLFAQDGFLGMWRPCSEGLPYPLNVNDLFEDNEGTLWLSTWGWAGLYKSVDGGFSWEGVEPDLGSGTTGWLNVYSMTEDAGGVLYLSANNGLVFRSLNRGAAWQQLPSLPGGSADTAWSLTGHAVRAGTVLAGTFGGGVYLTTDFGFTWAPLGGETVNDALVAAGGGHIFDIELSPDSPDFAFVGTATGVFRADAFDASPAWTNMGLTVSLDGGSTVQPEVRVLAFAPDAGGEDDLIVGTWGFGVFASADPVSTTGFVEMPFRKEFISSLTPVSGGLLFVGTQSAGTATIGGAVTSTAVAAGLDIPKEFALDQNYPNPFNPETTVRFALPGASHTSLRVFDVLGRQVASLVNGLLEAGHHEVRFQAGSLPSGVYLYVLSTSFGQTSRSLILAK